MLLGYHSLVILLKLFEARSVETRRREGESGIVDGPRFGRLY